MRIRNKLLALGCIAAAAGSLLSNMACNEHEIEPFSSSLVAAKKQLSTAGSTRQVDILFVIDNSNSMSEEQLSLDKNFGKFINKLMDANANFRIGVVTTSDMNPTMGNASFNTSPNKSFFTNARDDIVSEYGISQQEYVDYENALRAMCAQYFSEQPWIQSDNLSDLVSNGKIGPYTISGGESEKKKEIVRNLFRCSAMAGVDGAPIERGLSTMWKALSSNADFKREGSILSIVFVTDENDCSDSYINDEDKSVLAKDPSIAADNMSIISGNDTKACENKRNIEDSCTIAKRDMVTTSGTEGTSLVTASGQPIEYNGEKKLLREWCVQGDETAQIALCDCLTQHKAYEAASEEERASMTDCAAAANISFPVTENSCTSSTVNNLVPRSYYYNKIIDFVINSNGKFYRQQRADFADMTANEFKAEATELAKADVIIANIINRDEGMRYDGSFPETWCGSAGNQSYRYQLFAEMFDNDPIYAPICCSNEQYLAADSVVDANETCLDDSGNKIDCNQVCSATDNGNPALFGPVLGAIGKRIGEAVNTICAEAAPVTCKISDCNEQISDGVYDPTKPRSNPGPACTCLRGCNGNQVYLANSDREYTLCNEFRVAVGTAKSNDGVIEEGSYSSYAEGTDYKVDYESNYCYIRTGSPIQINLSRNDGGDLVIEFPKKTTN